MKELDYDKNSQISYSDFLIATLDVKNLLTKRRLKTIFNKFDSQCKKQITSQDLIDVLAGQAFAVSEKE